MEFLQSANAFTDYTQHILKVLVAYSPKFISALLILFVGLYAIRIINRLLRRVMLKRQLDLTLSNFLADILLWTLRVLLFVTFISRLGIETSSFVAILGAAGLAVGLSLQGSLSNFAGGMLIIMFKPFRVGDYIEAQGSSGTVAEIQIFVTRLLSANNQAIFIPNGVLSNGTIVNYSREEIRKADITIAISYTTDLMLAKAIITKVLNDDKRVLETPEPQVVVKDLTDHSILLAIRPWAITSEFWDMHAAVLENCKLAFDDAGIAIQPFVKEFGINKD
ncbi:MAG TPA: mechanosensitive ion channel domain-containing protein [Flavobacterium sp.]|jgi:small conductance mechanosensitive channel|nr:mechanosensitive ion channel domain-containing protein [Flavobacterium sp.]